MRFSQLTFAARVYVLACYALAGTVLWLGWAYAPASRPPDQVLVFLLAVALAAAHSFPVSTPGKQAYHVSLPFFVVAALLLSPAWLAALVVIAHAAEWARRRRSWYSQLFNVAVYLLSTAAVRWTYVALTAWTAGNHATVEIVRDQVPHFLAGLAAVVAFMAMNRVLVSGAIWLGNGIPPRQQGMFAWEPLAADALLLAMGLPLAYLGAVAPWAFVLAATPMLLVHRALDMPNVRAQRRQDSLTHLYTLPYVAEACARELARSRRLGHPLSVLAVDLDGLGRVNASLGTQTGDAVIRGTAQALTDLVRAYDVAARVVGGEFTVLLPETGHDQARAIAERLRQTVAARRYEVPSSVDAVSATASVGVATVDVDALLHGGVTTEQVLGRAEAALARAKQLGGNRVWTVSVEGELATSPATEPSPAPAASGAPAAPAAGAAPATPAVQRPTRAVRVLSALVVPSVVLAALAIAVNVAGQVPALDPPALITLLALISLAESRALELYGKSSWSIGVVSALAAGMLMGVPGAVVVAPASAILRGIQRRTRWYKVLFNASVYILAAAAAATLFGATGVPLGPANVARLVFPAAAAGLAYYLHTLVVAGAMATEMRASPWRVWAEHFRWLWPQYLVLGVMGLLLAVAYRAFGIIGAAAFAVPPLMMHYVAKQYMDRTLDNVRQLRALNDQLADEITQRKATERENARLLREAERAAAAEELSRLKGEFISIASHELRTPMSTILGFSELLLDQCPPDDPQKGALTIIYEDSVQLSRLVDNLLDISRIEAGRVTLDVQTVDLQAALSPILQAQVTAAPRHTIVLEITPEARWVTADPDKLAQIVANLVGNAVKYSPEGGRVLVAVQPGDAPQTVRLSVTDQGIGIPPEHLERIFERFHRVDSSETRSIRGTGLGLYIVQQFVQLHGGSIAVESRPGAGSTFHVTLPAAGQPAPDHDRLDHDECAASSPPATGAWRDTASQTAPSPSAVPHDGGAALVPA